MRTVSRILVGVLVLLLAFPPTLLPAFAQQAAAPGQGIGVVTALQGEATVTRAALPQPAPLRFRDDVFNRDQIVTRERSTVRLLLGGKGTLTIREQSQVLLDDSVAPDGGRRSMISLLGGKIGAAIARALMRSGEQVEVRTPNAVAAVRGTVFVVEYIPPPAAAEKKQPVLLASSAPGPFLAQAAGPTGTTNFFVLSGEVTVTPEGQPPVTVGALQTVSVTVTPEGAQSGPVTQMTQQQVQQATQGLETARQHIGEAEGSQTAQAQAQVAAAVATAVVQATAPVTEPTSPPPSTTVVDVVPEVSTGPQQLVSLSSVTLGLPSGVPFASFTGEGDPTGPVTPLSVSGTSKATDIVSVDGPVVSQVGAASYPTASLVTLSNADLVAAGGAPLLDAAGTSLLLGSTAFQLDGASALTTPSPVMELSGGATAAMPGLLGIGGTSQAALGPDPGALVGPGSTLTTGTLYGVSSVPSVGPGLLADGPLAAVEGGAETPATLLASGYLLNLSGSSATLYAPVLEAVDATVGAAGVASVTNSTLIANDSLLLSDFSNLAFSAPMLAVAGSGVPVGTFYGESSAPLFDLYGGTLTLTGSGSLLALNNDYASIGGSILWAAGSTITATGTSSPLVRVENGSYLNLGYGGSVVELLSFNPVGSLALATPILSISGGSHASLGGSILHLQMSGVQGGPGAGLLAMQGGTLRGSHMPLLYSDSGDLSFAGTLLSLNAGAELLGPSGEPLYTPLLYTYGGSLTLAGTGRLLALNAASLETGAPILSTSGTTVQTAGTLLDIQGGALSAPGAPLILLSGGTEATLTGGPLVNVSGGTLWADTLLSTDGSGNSLTIGGTILQGTNAEITFRALGEGPESGDLVAFTLPAGQPLIRMTNSTLVVTDQSTILGIGGGEAAETYAGTTLIASGSDVLLAGNLLELYGADLTGTTAQVQLGSTAFSQFDPSPQAPAGNGGDLVVVNDGSSTTAGPLLSATNSSIVTRGLLDQWGGNLTSSAAVPLYEMTGGSLTVGSNTDPAMAFQVDTGLALAGGGGLFKAGGTAVDVTGDFLNVGYGGSIDAAALAQPLIQFGSALRLGTRETDEYTYDGYGGSESGTSSFIYGTSLFNMPEGGSATLGHSLFAASNATVEAGSLVSLGYGATLTKQGPAPLLNISGGSVTAYGWQQESAYQSTYPGEGSYADSYYHRNGGCVACVGYGSALTIGPGGGPLLNAVGAQIATGTLLDVWGSVTSGGPSGPSAPLIQITGGTLTAQEEAGGSYSEKNDAGVEVYRSTGSTNVGMDNTVINLNGSMTLYGPLFAAGGGAAIQTATFLHSGYGGAVDHHGGSALVQLSGASLKARPEWTETHDSWYDTGTKESSETWFSTSASGGGPETVFRLGYGSMLNLSGPLFAAVNSAVNTTTFLALDEGGSLVGTGAGALVQLSGTPVTAQHEETYTSREWDPSGTLMYSSTGSTNDSWDTPGGFFRVAGSSLALNGPLLSASSSPITTSEFLVVGGYADSVVSMVNTSAALVQLANSPLTAHFQHGEQYYQRGEGQIYESSYTTRSGGAFLRVGEDNDRSAILDLGTGSLLSATGSAIDTDTLVEIGPDGSIDGVGTGPLVTLSNNSPLTARSYYLSESSSRDEATGSLLESYRYESIGGNSVLDLYYVTLGLPHRSFLSATDSPITTSTFMNLNHHSLLEVGTGGGGPPVVSLSNSPLIAKTLEDSQYAGASTFSPPPTWETPVSVVYASRNRGGYGGFARLSSSTVSLYDSTLLSAVNSPIQTGVLIELQGGSILSSTGNPESPGGSPVVQLQASPVTAQNTAESTTSYTSPSSGVRLYDSAWTGQGYMGGSILQSIDSTVNLFDTSLLTAAAGSHILATTLLSLYYSGGIVSQGSAPVVDLVGSNLTARSTSTSFSEYRTADGSLYSRYTDEGQNGAILQADSSPVILNGGSLLRAQGSLLETVDAIRLMGGSRLETGTGEETTAPPVIDLGGNSRLTARGTNSGSSTFDGSTETWSTDRGRLLVLNASEAQAILRGPLLSAVNGTVDVEEQLIHVSDGSFTSHAASGVIVLDGSTLTAGSLADIGYGGTLAMTEGPLLAAAQSAVTFTDTAVSVESPTSLTSTAPGVPLIATTGGTLALGGSLLSTADGRVEVGGSLLEARGTAVATGAAAEPLVSIYSSWGDYANTLLLGNGGSLVRLGRSAAGTPASFAGSGTLLRVENTAALVEGSLLDVRDGSSASINVWDGGSLVYKRGYGGLTIGGTILSLQGGSTVTYTGGPLLLVEGDLSAGRTPVYLGGFGQSDDTGNTATINITPLSLAGFLYAERADVTIAGTSLENGGEVPDTVAINVPAGVFQYRLLESSLTMLHDTDSLIDFGDVVGPQTYHGLLLDASYFSSVSVGGPVVEVWGNEVVTTTETTQALIQVHNGSSLESRNSSILAVTDGGKLTLAGPLLHTGSAAPSSVTSAGVLVGILGSGSELTSSGTSPLLDIETSNVAVGGDFPFVAGVFDGTLRTSGPLLRSIGSTISGGILGMDGGQAIATGTAPLLQFAGGSMNSGEFMPLVGARRHGSFTLAGGLIQAEGTTFVTDTFLGLGDEDSEPPTPAFLASTGTGPLIQLTSASVSSWGIVNLWENSTISLAGPLVTSTGSTIELSNGQILSLSNSSLTSTSTQPLILVSGGQFAYSGSSPETVVVGLAGDSSLQVGGPLLVMDGVTLGGEGGPSAVLGMMGGASLSGTGTAELIQFKNMDPVEMDVPIVAMGWDPAEPVNTVSNAGGLVKLDQATILAAGPVIAALKGALNLNTTPSADPNVGAINLYQSVITTLGHAFVLDRSDLTIHNGPLLSVTGGSTANIAGDFARLLGDSRIVVSNGPLISVDGAGSAVNVAGALVNFQGINNQVFVKNSVAPTSTLSGIPVSGASITIGANPVVNGTIQDGTVPSGSNTLTINPGASVIQTTNGGAVTITAP